mgnify:CR=1 FL=1
MFSKVKSCAVHGVDGRMIDVEADVNDAGRYEKRWFRI